MRRQPAIAAISALLALPACLAPAVGSEAFGIAGEAGGDEASGDAGGHKGDAGSDAGADVAQDGAAADAACVAGVGACDDANPCTQDSCVNSHCTHVAVLDLTPCSQGGKSGSCKKGQCQ